MCDTIYVNVLFPANPELFGIHCSLSSSAIRMVQDCLPWVYIFQGARMGGGSGKLRIKLRKLRICHIFHRFMQFFAKFPLNYAIFLPFLFMKILSIFFWKKN